MKGNRFLCTKLLLGICFAIFFTVTLTVAAAESAPDIEWQKCFGGLSDDYALSIQPTSDDGSIVTGYSRSNDGDITGNHGSDDYWIVKLDESGEMVWQKSLGGSQIEVEPRIQQTSDGGYIVAGYSNSNDGDVTGSHGGYDYWVMKLDESGEMVWEKCLGGSGQDYAYSINQTSDGGYIVAGYSWSTDGDVVGNHGSADHLIIKLDENGEKVWQKCLGGSYNDYARSIQQTSDGGYIVAGYTWSTDGDVSGKHGDSDYWVVKLDTIGDIEWQKCLGGSGLDYAFDIQQTSDGSYIVAGYTNSTDGDVTGKHEGDDYRVVKLDASGDLLWQKCLGGSEIEHAFSIQQASDGSYIVAGYTNSNDGNVTGNHGDKDCWVVKLDASGDLLWQKCLGGSNSDAAWSIQTTSDGGYIVAGASNSTDGNVTGNHGDYDYWVVKLDTSGDLLWQKCLGGSDSDYARSIQQTSDGGYIVAGSSRSNDGDVSGNHGSADYLALKLDTSGDLLWQKCLGGSWYDYARSIQQTSDGGYIVAGTSNSNDGDVTGNHGDYDYWVVKLDASEEIVWQKCLGGSYYDSLRSIQQTSDGGYIVAGYSNSNNGDVSGNHGYLDYWVVKLDTGGNILWQKCLGGSSYDYAFDIQQTSDGGYIVAGYSNSNDEDVSDNHGGGADYWVVKLDASGNILWQKCLGGSWYDFGQSIQQTSDGGYIVAGYSRSTDGNVTGIHGDYHDYWIVKLDTSGEMVWQKCLGGSYNDYAQSIRQTSDGGYIVAGYTWSTDGDVSGNHGNGDYWVVKLDTSGEMVWQKCLGGSSSDTAYSIQLTSDGGYIVAGTSNSTDGDVSGNHGGCDLWVVKLNFNTLPGTNVEVNPVSNISMKFSEVIVSGDTTVNISTTNPGSEKTGFKFIHTYYDINTTAQYTPPVTICFSYNDSDAPGNSESTLKVYQGIDKKWEALPTNLDTKNNTACVEVDSFSWFALAYENTAPDVTATGDTISENETATVVGTISDPDIADAFNVTIDWGDGDSETFPYPSGSNEFSEVHQYMDDDPSGTSSDDYTVTVTVDDGDGGIGTATATVTVNNVAPDVGEINSPVDPIQLGTSITVDSNFTDVGTNDTHTAVWDWGDDSHDPGTITESDGSGKVIGGHTYSSAGIYQINLTVTDDDLGSNYSVSNYVVIYDPEGGFVTGGGWINSPVGAYTFDSELTGKATFGFVSKYKKGATVPTGVTQFNFQVADLNFHSDTYQWLVIAGSKAKYKGTGTINGEGNYGFMLTAIDAELTPSTDVDLFRVKIWDKDNNDEIVYDNMLGEEDTAEPTTELQGGSIKIHKAK